MKKLWKALIMLTVISMTAAALTGWQFSRWAGRDTCTVGVIGSTDSPTSIIVTGDRGQGVTGAVFCLAFLFTNTFSSQGAQWYERSGEERSARKVGRP